MVLRWQSRTHGLARHRRRFGRRVCDQHRERRGVLADQHRVGRTLGPCELDGKGGKVEAKRNKQRNKQTNKQTSKQANKQTNHQMFKQTNNKQTNKQTNKHTNKCTMHQNMQIMYISHCGRDTSNSVRRQWPLLFPSGLVHYESYMWPCLAKNAWSNE